MEYVYNTYCKDQQRITTAIGTSMGGNILGNLLGFTGDRCFLNAAVVIHAPVKKWECPASIRGSAYGLYNGVMGNSLNTVMLRHEHMIGDMIKDTLGFTIKEWVDQKKGILDFDNEITAPINNWKDRDDYYRTSACYHRVPNIKIPTLFLNSKDDPIVGSKAVEYEIFK